MFIHVVPCISIFLLRLIFHCVTVWMCNSYCIHQSFFITLQDDLPLVPLAAGKVIVFPASVVINMKSLVGNQIKTDTDSPQLTVVQLPIFFSFTVMKSHTQSLGSELCSLIFSWAGDVCYDTVCSWHAPVAASGSSQSATKLSGQHCRCCVAKPWCAVGLVY